ncbi:hypothetical protein PR202_ga26679 [Eleusine coracana subsp. coracana]|uniref:Uncharacterized protein n=1 Tax=Eleusine coracana subsp. coracana TaxID=191504 RepID=A0AAV5DEQ4_ELECO|nr:hypothetical protein PR202_ga26679 [Eleusine coracana subsp. coracana]
MQVSFLLPSNGGPQLATTPATSAGEVMQQHPTAKGKGDIYRLQREINQYQEGEEPHRKKPRSSEGAATLGWKPFLLAFAPLLLVSFGSSSAAKLCACVRARGSAAAFKRE